tara:strand:- start:735 stop:977 length:243 start_codon:yes stop_codon:yes gene_type:complete
MISPSSIEYRVNEWLDKPVISNNGYLIIDTALEYTYRHYCDEFYYKIRTLLSNNNHSLFNEDEFKDRTIYFLYKYCEKNE